MGRATRVHHVSMKACCRLLTCSSSPQRAAASQIQEEHSASFHSFSLVYTSQESSDGEANEWLCRTRAMWRDRSCGILLALPINDVALSQRTDLVVREESELALWNTGEGSREPLRRVVSLGNPANPDTLNEVASKLPKSIMEDQNVRRSTPMGRRTHAAA